MVGVCARLVPHLSVVRHTASASPLIPADPLLIRPVAGGLPVFVATDPVRKELCLIMKRSI